MQNCPQVRPDSAVKHFVKTRFQDFTSTNATATETPNKYNDRNNNCRSNQNVEDCPSQRAEIVNEIKHICETLIYGFHLMRLCPPCLCVPWDYRCIWKLQTIAWSLRLSVRKNASFYPNIWLEVNKYISRSPRIQYTNLTYLYLEVINIEFHAKQFKNCELD